MTQTSIKEFERTIQKTNEWLNDLGERLDSQDKEYEYHVMKAVLHAFRDRLTIEEVKDLGEQLPMLIRGFYYDSWNPDGLPVKIKTKEEFYDYVKEKYPGSEEIDPEKATTAVMGLLSDKVSRGEIEDIRAILPSTLL